MKCDIDWGALVVYLMICAYCLTFWLLAIRGAEVAWLLLSR